MEVKVKLDPEDRDIMRRVVCALDTVGALLGKMQAGQLLAVTPEQAKEEKEPLPAAPVPDKVEINTPSGVGLAKEEKEPLPDYPIGDEAPWEGPKKEDQGYTCESLQHKVVELCAAGKKDEVRAIIKQYADKVSGIPEEKYGEVMQKLNVIQ